MAVVILLLCRNNMVCVIPCVFLQTLIDREKKYRRETAKERGREKARERERERERLRHREKR